MAGKPPPEKQCTAMSKRTGNPCEAWAVEGMRVCYHHGGRSPKGAASGTWKHGQHSRYTRLPKRLREGYERAVTDPELTHHRSSVALVDSLVDEMLEEYQYGAAPEMWEQVQRLVRRLEVANNAGDYPRAREAFKELVLVVNEGHGHAQQSLALTRLLEARRRHADSETKRKLSEALTFSYEVAFNYYLSLGTAARRWFGGEPEKLRGFLNEVTAISNEHGLEARDHVGVGEGDDQRGLAPGGDT